MAGTKKEYEKHLNQVCEGCYSWEEIKEQYGHLTTSAALHRHFKNGTLGTLSRKKDPITFHAGYNTWKIGK